MKLILLPRTCSNFASKRLQGDLLYDDVCALILLELISTDDASCQTSSYQIGIN